MYLFATVYRVKRRGRRLKQQLEEKLFKFSGDYFILEL